MIVLAAVTFASVLGSLSPRNELSLPLPTSGPFAQAYRYVNERPGLRWVAVGVDHRGDLVCPSGMGVAFIFGADSVRARIVLAAEPPPFQRPLNLALGGRWRQDQLWRKRFPSGEIMTILLVGFPTLPTDWKSKLTNVQIVEVP